MAFDSDAELAASIKRQAVRAHRRTLRMAIVRSRPQKVQQDESVALTEDNPATSGRWALADAVS